MSLALVIYMIYNYKRMRKRHWDEEMLYEKNAFESLEINQEHFIVF